MTFKDFFETYRHADNLSNFELEIMEDAWNASQKRCLEDVIKAFDKFPIPTKLGCTKAMMIATKAIENDE